MTSPRPNDQNDRNDQESWESAAAFAHRLARSLVRDPTLASDVAQDVMVQALQAGAPQPRGWLATVTRRLAGRALRDRRERPARESVAGGPVSGNEEQCTIDRLTTQRRLVDAMAALPEPYRTVVRMRYFDDLPPRAIGKRMQLRPEAVRQQLHRGLAMLRARLDLDYGGRRQWLVAFAASGLGGVTAVATPLLIAFAMKKILVVGLAVLAFGVWWCVSSDGVPTAPEQTAGAGASAAAGGLADATSNGAAVTEAPVADPVLRTEFAFRMTVVDEDQRPQPGVEIWCWRDGATEAMHERTNDAGRISLPPSDGPGGVLIAAASRPPLLESVPAMHGEHTFVLQPGHRVAGFMLVDGEPAPAGLRLGLTSSGAKPEAGLPEVVAKIFRGYLGQCFTATREGGAFAFEGLADDWRGTLNMPPTHWRLQSPDGPFGNPERLSLTRPVADLVLATTQLPTVAGRIVWDDDGSPIANCHVAVMASFADGMETPYFSFRADAAGHFAAGLLPMDRELWRQWSDPSQRPAFRSAVVLVSDVPGSSRPGKVDLKSDELPAYAVEVRIPRAAVKHFVVTDRAGKPIAGARISNDEGVPTDLAGRGTFRAPHEDLLVGADGYAVVPAEPQEGSGSADDPLHFVLEPTNRLGIRVRGADGIVPPIRSLVIDSPCDLFAGRRLHSKFDSVFGGSEANCDRSGPGRPDGNRLVTRWTCTVTTDAEGLAVLHSLEPGLECTVKAVDALGLEITSESFVTPAFGAEGRVELSVSERFRHVRGRVLATDGNPIANADLTLYAENHGTSTRSDVDGNFVFGPICTDEAIRLLAAARGFVAAELTEITPARDAASHDFHLAPGRTVTVHCVDEKDQPVALSVWPVALSHQGWQKLGTGVYQWSDLPAVPTFYVRIGGTRFEVCHESSEPEAFLRVPSPAMIEVAWPLDWPVPERTQGYVTVEFQRLDVPGEQPFLIDVNLKAGEPTMVLPGRYRIALVMNERVGEPPQRRARPLGPQKTVEVAAGERASVTLTR